MRLTWSALCLTAIVLTVEGGRFGGGGRSGGSRSSGRSGGWGSSSSSRSSGYGSHSSSSGSSWSSKPSSSWSSGSSSSYGGGVSSGRVVKPQAPTHFSNSHLVPISTGARTPGGVKPNVPSAPPLPSASNPHAPSAPSLPNSGSHPSGHPPAPGWKPAVTNDAAQRQNINNLNSQHPGAPPPYPGAPGHYPNQAPPPYPGTSGHYPNQPPPPYPGGAGHYPNQAPPPYPGSNQHYPNHPPPAYSPGGNPHYPVQQGGPVYQQQYYPAPPPPPPGYSPYGTPYYKDRSGIRGSDVVAGLALWELMRSRNHYHGGYGVQQVHHHHYQDGTDTTMYNQPTYHDTMRERYTTRTTPNRQTTGPGAYNILEMTHYITPDDKGVISSSEGNMTCISVYNAKSVSEWHQRQVNDFQKQYPNSTFPLYRMENDTQSENFTVIPGRIIHREPISITCCGTNKGPVDLNLLTNGKHPNVNCVNQLGHIPIKKLVFVRTQAQIVPVNTTGWHEIQLHDPNATTPVPLAPFPTNFSSNSSPPTPLTSLPTNLTNTSTETPLTPLASFPSNVTETPTMNQTVAPIETKNDTETVDMTQVFDSLKSNSTNNITEGVTDKPGSLVVW